MTLACGSRLLLDYFVFVFALCERKRQKQFDHESTAVPDLAERLPPILSAVEGKAKSFSDTTA
jgi:hypothetical protein